jgi:hypothetical protein
MAVRGEERWTPQGGSAAEPPGWFGVGLQVVNRSAEEGERLNSGNAWVAWRTYSGRFILRRNALKRGSAAKPLSGSSSLTTKRPMSF